VRPAGEWVLQVLAMRESSLGPHHLEVAASLNNLAVLLKTVGANEEAEALYTRSIQIKETVLGSNHPQVIPIIRNIALDDEQARERGEGGGVTNSLS
jgi:hypothetical protein